MRWKDLGDLLHFLKVSRLQKKLVKDRCDRNTFTVAVNKIVFVAAGKFLWDTVRHFPLARAQQNFR